ncbi:hypothetical protein EDB89DRAFT_1906822 [Lactarius sanguifluus]|nr:hypothetical protein EDB89DRAFT_1906822 [Lactarius sanguifluus]
MEWPRVCHCCAVQDNEPRVNANEKLLLLEACCKWRDGESGEIHLLSMDHLPHSSPSNGFSEPLSIFLLDESYDLQAALELAFFLQAEAEASDQDQLTHEASTSTPPPLAPQPLSNTSPPPHTSSQQPLKVLFSAKGGPTGLQLHNKLRQQKRRQKQHHQTGPGGVSIKQVPKPQVRPNMFKRHGNISTHTSSFNTLDLSHNQGGWTSPRYEPSAQGEDSLEGLLAEGYKCLPIDDSPNSGIVDSKGHLFVIRRPPPLDTPGQKPWLESMEALKGAMN